MTGDIGRRERKKLQTREALLAAGVRLFEERGYARTTIEDITEAADTSPRTFFRYFRSKEDLLVDHIANAVPVAREALAERRKGESMLRAVRRAALAVTAAVAQPDHLAFERLVHGTPEVRGHLLEQQQQIDDAMVEGCARLLGVDPDLDPGPRLLASIALGAIRSAIHGWIASDGREDAVSLVGKAFDMFDEGPAAFWAFAQDPGSLQQ